MRVEIIGGMACGKTTLAKELQKLGAQWVAEDLDSNPFLKDCYNDFKTFRFPSQMWFALTKYREIGLYNDPNTIYVHDQAVVNNNAYTNLLYQDSPTDKSKELVQETFDYTTEVFGQPDVFIRLYCSPKEQLQRVKKRGRDYEKDITQQFLIQLENHIDALFQKASPFAEDVILISSDAVDFEDDEDFVKDLFNHLQKVQEKINGTSISRHSNVEISA
jgi:deoxyguanosine kinase